MAQTTEANANFRKIINKNNVKYAGRGAHAKGHSCVKAWFQVAEDLCHTCRHGIFSDPGRRYKAWIRFSNANSNYAASHDANKDAHGMAIKVLGIDGEPLTTAGDSEVSTQDFLMADNPAFFSPDIDEYNRFLGSESTVNFFFAGFNPFKWRLREFFIALDTLKKPPGNPLWIQYYSNTAYKLGPHNIKFSARPCHSDGEKYSPDEQNPDFMRDNLTKELQENKGCFHFLVQLQDPEKNMPVEDPSVEWKEEDSPFFRAATITIPVQVFNTPEQLQFCENLSFSPWHALEAHRPIGQFNRIRRHVYRASSDYRHAVNQTVVPADIIWGE